MKHFAIRKAFIDFFEKKRHRFVPSSSLVPTDDPSLLFTNAGMNPFKETFLGLKVPENTRVVSVQKCLRAGGKHNDLENVGYTARHHTFFEMLGNFSFGDYFKKDAINWAWDFLNDVLNLPEERLFVTVHNDDEESFALWQKGVGISGDRLFRLGDADNFWRMGDVGPCGPSSEVYFDFMPKKLVRTPSEFLAKAERGELVEIWNLVFMQYEEGTSGRVSLPMPSVDTGAGLERLASVLQGVSTNYHTDLFLPIFSAIGNVVDKDDLAEVLPARVVADHARAIAFLIGDGVLPGAEGRSYVLRRILRRATRFARDLSKNDGKKVMLKALEAVIEEMGTFYPELCQNRQTILSTTAMEVERFYETLESGLDILEKVLAGISGTTFPGDQAFRLYDTYGFPRDLTELLLRERGYVLDDKSWQEAAHRAKERSKSRSKFRGFSEVEQSLKSWTLKFHNTYGSTEFVGYDSLSLIGKVGGLHSMVGVVEKVSEGEDGYFVSKKTPFYAEGGGQVADTGQWKTETGEGDVQDVQSLEGVYVHKIMVRSGYLAIGQVIQLHVDQERRNALMQSHSATHILHYVLRSHLGDHVVQAGSLVEPGTLRFDFTHQKGLAPNELRNIEVVVNEWISRGTQVTYQIKPYGAAIADGAMALFGEKYTDEVRVIRMGSSIELCGGTHVNSLSEIRYFKILHESSVGAGVRRIEALCGNKALKYVEALAEENLKLRAVLGLESADNVLERWVEGARAEKKDLEAQLYRERLQKALESIDELPTQKTSQSEWTVATVSIADRKALMELSDRVRNVRPKHVILLFSSVSPHHYVLSIPKALLAKSSAREIARLVNDHWDGKGGGRPDFCQGSVSQIGSVESLMSIFEREGF